MSRSKTRIVGRESTIMMSSHDGAEAANPRSVYERATDRPSMALPPRSPWRIGVRTDPHAARSRQSRAEIGVITEVLERGTVSKTPQPTSSASGSR
jgi:hypothetical protein